MSSTASVRSAYTSSCFPSNSSIASACSFFELSFFLLPNQLPRSNEATKTYGFIPKTGATAPAATCAVVAAPKPTKGARALAAKAVDAIVPKCSVCVVSYGF